jgi:hypothetical protein
MLGVGGATSGPADHLLRWLQLRRPRLWHDPVALTRNMTPQADQLRREARVAFSPRWQPIWFRVLKWMIFSGVTAYLWGTRSFWIWILFIVALTAGIHLLWRYKTKGWREPWAGWDDIDTAEGRKPDKGESEWKAQL